MGKKRSGLALHRKAYSWTIATFDISLLSGVGSSDISNLTQVNIPGTLYDVSAPGFAALDDGDVPIPMAGMTFNFFGINHTNSLYWSSNNALVFGTPNALLEVNISRATVPAILLGNYDRLLKTFYYSNFISTNYSITTLLVTFYNYYTDLVGATTYQYKIRLIKENTGSQRQFVEVYVISSPPSTGYSSAIVSYPSGSVDANGNAIDSTKNSPYNITNGTAFQNTYGSFTNMVSNQSFVLQSDINGNNWTFYNNYYVNI